MIEALSELAALAVALAGLIVFLSGAASGRWRLEVPFAVDLWLAASLLGLIGEPSWLRFATAAVIVGAQNLMLLGRSVSK